MKLRILGNSIRLRLTKSEVEQLTNSGSVEEELDLGSMGERLVYALERTPEAQELTARLRDGELRVYVPDPVALQWASSSQVGIQTGEMSNPRILIEKDFACLSARPGEDESDMFSNPGESPCTAGED